MIDKQHVTCCSRPRPTRPIFGRPAVLLQRGSS